MQVEVGPNRYGKQNVRLLRVIRDTPRHEPYALTCSILLESKDFAVNYTNADNSSLLPTETQKNTLYVLAKKYPIEPIERWGVYVAKDIMGRFPHIEAVNLNICRQPWARAIIDGKEHNHVFLESNTGTQFTNIRAQSNGDIVLSAGFEDLKIMKTTQSGFEGFIQDEYTTLKPTRERVMATKIFCEYTFNQLDIEGVDFSGIYKDVQKTIIEKFSGDPESGVYSPSVQQTLHDVAKALLERHPILEKMTFKLPNIHYYLVNFKDFKTDLENKNEVFFTFDGARGQIEGTIQRKATSKL